MKKEQNQNEQNKRKGKLDEPVRKQTNITLQTRKIRPAYKGNVTKRCQTPLHQLLPKVKTWKQQRRQEMSMKWHNKIPLTKQTKPEQEMKKPTKEPN